MSPRIERLAAAFFDNKDDATQAVGALRQAGFAQIGVASHDDNQERKLAGSTATQPGLAVSPHAGPELERTDQDADYASIADVYGTLVAAGFTPHQAGYYRDRLERNGILVTAAASAGQWHTAQRTLEDCGGEVATAMPDGASAAEQADQQRIAPPPAEPAHPATSASPANPRVRRESGTPQSDFEMSSGMAPIELRGTLRDLHRERHAEDGHKAA